MRYTHGMKFHRRRKTYHISLAALFLFILAGALFYLASISGTDLYTFSINLAASTIRVFVAYFLSLGLAVTIAFLTTRNKTVEDLLLPFLDLMQSFPSFAILPLAILMFGSGTITAIFFLVLTMIWPILFTVISSLHGIRKDLEEAVEIFGASGWKKLRYFTIPLIYPGIVSGSIVAWGEGWEAIVGAELIGITTGVGAYLFNISQLHETRLLIFGIILLMFFVFLLNKIIWLPLLKDSLRYQQES